MTKAPMTKAPMTKAPMTKAAMTESVSYYRPLSLPRERWVRVGHCLLIGMMLPMLLPMTLIGMLFGRYGAALKHARLATLHHEAHAPSGK